eukprot:tig00000826_g4583.t2
MATRVQDASIRGLLMLGCSFEGQRTMGDAAPWPSACRRGDDLELGCGRLGQIKIDPERKPTLRLLIVKNPSSCSAARENDDACTTGRLKRELEDARKAISRRMQPTIARKKPLADEEYGCAGAGPNARLQFFVAHADVAIICETVKLIAFYNTLLIAFVASVVLVIVCMIASTSANTVTRWLELHYKK